MLGVTQSERLQKAWRREHTRFKHDYNDKLYNGLVLLLLVDILMFRFVIKFSILESLGWVVFLFLQVRLAEVISVAQVQAFVVRLAHCIYFEAESHLLVVICWVDVSGLCNVRGLTCLSMTGSLTCSLLS